MASRRSNLTLELNAETSGEQDIEGLAQALLNADSASAELKDEARKLATELDKLTQQKALTAQFKAQAEATGRAGTAFREAKGELGRLSQEVDSATKPSKRLLDQQARAKQRTQELAAAYRDETAKLGDLRGKMDRAGVATKNLGATQDKLAGETTRATQRLRDLASTAANTKKAVAPIERLKAAASGLAGKFKSTVAAFKASSKGLDNFVKKAKTTSGIFGTLKGKVVALGGALTTYFGARALGRLFSGGIQASGDFDAALSRVGAKMGASAEQMTALRAEVERLHAIKPYNARQVAEGLEFLAQAGLDATQAIETLPSVLDLATAGGLELADSADILTNTLSGMGQGADQAGRFADVLAKGAASANTSVQELGVAASYAAPTAAAMGVSFEELVAIVGKFSDAGIQGERAGTALNGILAQMQDPASTASRALEQLGISTEDPIQAIRDLAAAGPEGSAAIAAFGQRAGPALQALLLQGTDSLDELIEKLRDSGGAARTMAERMQDNLIGALKILSSAWEALRAKLVKPLMEPLEREILSLAATFRNWAGSAQLEVFADQIAGAFNKGVAAVKAFAAQIDLGAVLSRLGTVVTNLGDTFTAFGERARAALRPAEVAIYAVQAAWLTFRSIVEGVGARVSGILAMMANKVTGVIELMSSVGLVSEQIALKARILTETLKETADTYAKAAKQHLAQAGRNVGALADTVTSGKRHLDDFAKAAAEAQTKAKDLAVEINHQTAEAVRGLAEAKVSLKEALRAGDQNAILAAIEEVAKAERALGAAVRETGRATEKASKQMIVATQDLATETERAANRAQLAMKTTFERAGIETRSALQTAAAEARTDYKTILASGQATAEGLKEAWVRWAKAAVEANEGVVPAQVEIEARSRGYEDVLDGLGKTGKQAGKDIADGMKKAADETEDASDAAEDLDDNLNDAAQQTDAFMASTREVASAMGSALSATANKWGQVSDAARDYFLALRRDVDRGVSFADFYSAIGEADRQVQALVDKERRAVERVIEETQDLEHVTLRQVRAAERAVKSIDLLDNASLNRAQAAVDRLRDAYARLQENIAAAAAREREEYLQLIGDQEGIENLRHAERMAQLREYYEQASGAEKRRAKEAMDYAERNHRIRIQNLRREERQASTSATERYSREADEASRASEIIVDKLGEQEEAVVQVSDAIGGVVAGWDAVAAAADRTIPEVGRQVRELGRTIEETTAEQEERTDQVERTDQGRELERTIKETAAAQKGLEKLQVSIERLAGSADIVDELIRAITRLTNEITVAADATATLRDLGRLELTLPNGSSVSVLAGTDDAQVILDQVAQAQKRGAY